MVRRRRLTSNQYAIQERRGLLIWGTLVWAPYPTISLVVMVMVI